MAETRLNKADREAIATAIIEYKYNPQIAANRAAETKLAGEVYDRIYTANLQRKMKALPVDAFPETDDLMVAVNGQKFVLDIVPDGYDELGRNVAVDIEKRALVRVLYKHRKTTSYNRQPALHLMDDDALGAAIVEWRADRDRLKTEPGLMLRKLEATLAQFLYFDDLIAQSPEAEAFILKRWRERPEGGSPGVPAVVIKDLARELDLPPEVQGEAA